MNHQTLLAESDSNVCGQMYTEWSSQPNRTGSQFPQWGIEWIVGGQGYKTIGDLLPTNLTLEARNVQSGAYRGTKLLVISFKTLTYCIGP